MIRALTLLSLCLLPLPATAQQVLAGDQIRADIVDRVLSYDGREDGARRTGTLVYRGDNRILIRTENGFIDSGSWRIAEDQLCTRIRHLRDNAETCFEIARLRGGTFVTSHDFMLRPQDE